MINGEHLVKRKASIKYDVKNTDKLEKIINSIQTVPIINKIVIVMDKMANTSENFNKLKSLLNKTNYYVVKSQLSCILKNLLANSDSSYTLLSKGNSLETDNVVFISNGILYMSLNYETCFKTNLNATRLNKASTQKFVKLKLKEMNEKQIKDLLDKIKLIDSLLPNLYYSSRHFDVSQEESEETLEINNYSYSCWLDERKIDLNSLNSKIETINNEKINFEIIHEEVNNLLGNILWKITAKNGPSNKCLKSVQIIEIAGFIHSNLYRELIKILGDVAASETEIFSCILWDFIDCPLDFDSKFKEGAIMAMQSNIIDFFHSTTKAHINIHNEF